MNSTQQSAYSERFSRLVVLAFWAALLAYFWINRDIIRQVWHLIRKFHP